MSYFNAIKQDVQADPYNSSTANLNASATFTGSATSTLGVSAIQVSLYATQNCSVWVEQSPDGNNWDISDLYDYLVGIGNFGITTQAINSYFRVRVKNIGSIATTSLRLQSVLCPIVESLPRSLSEHGNLKVSISENSDLYGFEAENTPTGELRSITPYRLVGSSFTGSVLDSVFWIGSSGSASGSVVPVGSQVILTTGSITGGSSVIQSVRTARYIGGSSNRYRSVVRLPDTGTVGNTRRWGAFTTTDGAFFQLSGSAFGVVTRKTSVDTLVSGSSFNGLYGTNYALDTNVKTYEIYWTNSKVYFALGGLIIHTVNANSDTWADTMSLPVRAETSGTSGTNLNIRVATIYRLGDSISQPNSYYLASGQTAGTQLKIGAGNLHSVIINGYTNNAVITLSDSVNAATPVIFSMTATATSGIPINLDFKGLPFFTGLRLVVSAANASTTVIYE